MAEKNQSAEVIGQALWGVFHSPNVLDSNLESANIVDVLASVADGLRLLAKSVHELAQATTQHKAGTQQ